jgi:DNA-binding NarL/FixJ family response regulator
VLVADDETSVREALRRVVDSTAGYTCIGALDSADTLIAAIIKLQPDIVMLDLRMPGRNVIEAIIEICQYLRYACHVVVVSGVCERLPVQTVMTLGSAAYVVKEDGPEAIQTALKAVTASERWLSPSAAKLFAPDQLPVLTAVGPRPAGPHRPQPGPA